jgi:CubicO group peptidase (beta-lactamase class C family)
VSNRVVEVVERVIAAGECAGAAVGVARGGQTLFEHYAGEAAPGIPASAESIWPLASISKLFTAATLFRLIDEGELGIELPAGPVVGAARGDGREQIRLRHLLGHTAGFRYESPRLEELLRERVPLRAIVADARDADLLFPPGTRFSYSDDGYLFAGQLAEAMIGDPFPELVQRLVADEMGLRSTWLAPPVPAQERIAHVLGCMAEGTDGAMYNSAYGRALAHPAFGVVSTLPDMLRFAFGFAPGGRRIHHERSLQLMTTPQVEDVVGVHPIRPELGEIRVGWGLGFEVQTDTAPNTFSRHASLGAFGHGGASGCRLVIDPASGITAVVLTNTHLRTGLAPWMARLDALTDAAFEDALAT